MLMIDNSPKGFPFRYKIIDYSLTIIFDLACWLYVLATLWLTTCGAPQYLVFRIVYCVSRNAQFYILNSILPF